MNTRNMVIKSGTRFGTQPGTSNVWYVLDGKTWLVTDRAAVNYGDYFAFCEKVRKGGVRFAKLESR